MSNTDKVLCLIGTIEIMRGQLIQGKSVIITLDLMEEF